MSDVVVKPFVNNYGGPSVMIEGIPSEHKSIELVIFERLLENIIKQKEGATGVQVGISCFERAELVCQRHELPLEFRQEQQEVLNLQDVPFAYKRKIKGIMIDSILFTPPPETAVDSAEDKQ